MVIWSDVNMYVSVFCINRGGEEGYCGYRSQNMWQEGGSLFNAPFAHIWYSSNWIGVNRRRCWGAEGGGRGSRRKSRGRSRSRRRRKRGPGEGLWAPRPWCQCSAEHGEKPNTEPAPPHCNPSPRALYIHCIYPRAVRRALLYPTYCHYCTTLFTLNFCT